MHENDSYDQVHQEQHSRYVDHTYVPKRGQGITRVNQLQSSMGNVLNMEIAKRTGANQENPRVSKNVNQTMNSAGNMIHWKSEAQLDPAYNSINARFN